MFSVVLRSYGFAVSSRFGESRALHELRPGPEAAGRGGRTAALLIRDVGRDVRGGRCSQVLFSGVLSLRGSEDGVFGAGVAVARSWAPGGASAHIVPGGRACGPAGESQTAALRPVCSGAALSDFGREAERCRSTYTAGSPEEAF